MIYFVVLRFILLTICLVRANLAGMNNALSTKVPAGAAKVRLLTPEDIAIEISRPVRYVLTLIRVGDGISRLPATRIGGKTYRIDPRVWENWKSQRITS